MDTDLSIRAGNYYTHLLEQGAGRSNAVEHTRLHFGLSDEELRYVVAHSFSLENSLGSEIESELSNLLLIYAEAREARLTGIHIPNNGEIPYYGD